MFNKQPFCGLNRRFHLSIPVINCGRCCYSLPFFYELYAEVNLMKNNPINVHIPTFAVQYIFFRILFLRDPSNIDLHFLSSHTFQYVYK